MHDRFPGARRTRPAARAPGLALALALALGAAPGLRAAPPPPAAPDPAPDLHYTSLARLLRGQHPALLVNPCVLREEIRDRFVVKSKSQDWGTRVGTTVLNRLNAHGLPAGPLMVPLICAQGRTDQTLRAADTLRAKRGPASIPIPADPSLAPPLQEAYQGLYAAVSRAAEPDPLFPADEPPETRFLLSPDERTRLVQAVGGRYVWVLNLAGADVSRLHGFDQRLFARVAPRLANGDPGRAEALYALGLVDLESAAVLWKRSDSGAKPPTMPGHYDAAWADQLLAPLTGPAPDD